MNRKDYWSKRTHTGILSIDSKPHYRLPKIRKFFHILKELFMIGFVCFLLLGILAMTAMLIDGFNTTEGIIIVCVIALICYLWNVTGKSNGNSKSNI